MSRLLKLCVAGSVAYTAYAVTHPADGLSIWQRFEAQAQASSPPPPPLVVGTASDLQSSDGTATLPSCNDEQSPDQLSDTIESSGPVWLQRKVFSVDKITSEQTTSGRQLCHASVFMNTGPQAYDFQWLAHNGRLYMIAMPSAVP